MIDVEHDVELIGHTSFGVVADQLGLGPVDHADGTVQACLAQVVGQCLVQTGPQRKARMTDIVEQRLDAAGPCSSDDKK